MIRNIIKNKISGSALAYALVIMSASMIILVSLIGYLVSQLNFSYNRTEKEKSLQIAESGAFWYRWYLAHELAGKSAQQINDFWQGGTAYGISAPYEKEFFDPEGGAIGKYEISVTQPESNSTIVIVKSKGWTYSKPETARTVQVRFRRPSWSEYAVLANDFMRFGQGTSVYGKIHSNKGIRFDGTAHNIISSLMANHDDPDHSGAVEFGVHTHVNIPPASGVNENFRPLEAPNNPVMSRTDVFLAGRQFPVPEINFNGVLSDLAFMKAQSQKPSSGRYFDASGYGRRIVLKTNGTMDVRRVNNYNKDTFDSCGKIDKWGTGDITNESSATNYSIPNGGVIFVENNVWVEGSINNKKVTIVAANLTGGEKANIYLGRSNLTYTNIDGRDIIGLVAQKDIEIIKNSLSNLRIDAALIAQSGRVGRKYYSCLDYSSNWSCISYGCSSYMNPRDSKNTITINGSLATNLRYGFAYTDNTGYINRNLNFDNNLLYYPPPYFPTGTQYSIDLWEEL